MDCSSCGQTIVEFSTGKRCRACKKAYDARRCERLKLESKILIEEKMCCRCEQTKTDVYRVQDRVQYSETDEENYREI